MLTPADMEILQFYHLVRDQYINQTPMGMKDGGVRLTPRYEGYEVVLRAAGYDREDWLDLITWATFMHEAVHKQAALELRKLYFQPDETFEDVTYGEEE